jgi:hypothetical protein
MNTIERQMFDALNARALNQAKDLDYSVPEALADVIMHIIYSTDSDLFDNGDIEGRAKFHLHLQDAMRFYHAYFAPKIQ